MNSRELTELLTKSAEDFHQSKLIPWWVEDYEKFTYRYHMMDRDTIREAKECLGKCGKEELLTPTGKLKLTLFHLLVWHNFYDDVKGMLEDGRVEAAEADLPDHGGHGLTPFLLACARGNLAMAELLLKAGADDSRCDDRGMNAYHFLVYPRFEQLDNDFDALERSVKQRAEIARLLTCDINAKNGKGLTPLEQLLSAEYCDQYTWPLTEVFLEKGAATGYVDEDGNTLLMMACRNGHDTAALQLMKHCPGLLDVPNKKGVTPAGNAIDFCNYAMYIALTDHGASPVPHEDMKKFPLSQIADNAFSHVYPDNMDSLSLGLYMVERIIRQADPDDDDEVGELTSVVESGLRFDKEARVLDICRDAGLNFTMPVYYTGDTFCLRDKCIQAAENIVIIRKLAEMGVDMDSAVAEGRTPANLLASVNGCDDSEEEIFLQEAAKLFSKESMEQTDNYGETALHLAAENGHVLMLKVMTEKGADVNLTEDAPAEAGTTPLHLACARGHIDVVKALMAAGADDTLKTVKGDTPAHLVVKKSRWGRSLDSEQMAGILKELKHSDIPGEDGRTPLMLIGREDSELLSLLIEKGADVNRRDNMGMTALMIHMDKDTAKVLLRAGADISLTDKEGNTALHHALMHGAQGEARYLIRKGADYNCPNNEGETPVQLAVEKGCEAVLELMTDIKQ